MGHAISVRVDSVSNGKLAGAVAGIAGGLFGVGGGIVLIPILTGALRLTQHQAHGTSLAVILIAAPAGAIEHHRHGNVVLRLVPWLALGAAAGGPLASYLAQRLPQAVLARGFAVCLLASAVQLWLKSGTGQKAQPDPEVNPD